MSGDEAFRAEWAMALELKASEIFPAWCYEFMRQHLGEVRQAQAAVDKAIAAGEEVPLPDVKAARLNWDDPWGGQFKTPYLLLNEQQRALLNGLYETDFAERLQKIIRDAIKAEREDREVSDAQRAQDVAFEQTTQALVRKIYESDQRGRGAVKSQLRRDLRALGVYRLEKAGYKFGRLPREPHDIQLYNSQQRWNEARKRAFLLIQFAPVFVDRLLKNFPRNYS
jgi:hypothetical protein